MMILTKQIVANIIATRLQVSKLKALLVILSRDENAVHRITFFSSNLEVLRHAQANPTRRENAYGQKKHKHRPPSTKTRVGRGGVGWGCGGCVGGGGGAVGG